jgi:branched-chain amino acid aminotransferase
MAPTAIQTTSELTSSGIRNTVNKTAFPLNTNGVRHELSELDASKLIFTRNLNPKLVPEPNSSAVWAQKVCSDHMITCQWTSTTGWAAPHLQPYGPLQLMPTASVFHYATECFEGLKVRPFGDPS